LLADDVVLEPGPVTKPAKERGYELLTNVSLVHALK
tara:strand:+ start:330 stop:437 length:108 start_codon:yes stop_codon:yes gene_type:complete